MSKKPTWIVTLGGAAVLLILWMLFFRSATDKNTLPTSPLPSFQESKEANTTPKRDEFLQRLRAAPDEQAQMTMIRETAANGTPESVQELLKTIPALPEGDVKEEIGGRIAAMRNRKVAGILLEARITMDDPTATQAAAESLRHLIDRDLLQQLIARYKEAKSEDIKTRLLYIVATVRNHEAEKPLIEALSQEDILDPRLLSAIRIGLASLGTASAAEFLIQQLDGAQGEHMGELYRIVGAMSQDSQRDPIEAAAFGNKLATKLHTRLVAIQALGNYRDERTVGKLRQLVTDENQQIREEAEKILATLTQEKDEQNK